MTCSKIAYNSRRDAQTHLNHINRAKYSRGKRVKRSHKTPKRSYLCPDCNKWHLTSKE